MAAGSAALDRRQQIERSIIKKYRKPIWNRFVGGVKDYHLIEEGDRIAVCLSGGKDSMLMAKCLQELQRHSYLNFSLQFLVMDPGYRPENRRRIEENAALLGLPVQIFESEIFAAVETAAQSPCYLCARMRRGHLYSYAKQAGCNKIALGHHFDDVIETVLMSMLYSAEIKTMMPKLRSQNFAGMELIRPLYQVRERDIIAWANYNGLQFLQCACSRTAQEAAGGGDGGRRRATKELIRSLQRQNPQVGVNIFRSIHNLNLKTVIGYTGPDGRYHHFLDGYEGRPGRPQAAVFDLDGTLLDSMWVWRDLAANYLRGKGVDPPPGLARQVRGLDLPQAVAFLIERFGLDCTAEQAAAEITSLAADAYARQVQLKPFARDYLDQLRRQEVPLCLATASPAQCVQPALQRLGLAQGYFSLVVTGGGPGPTKQSPEYFARIATRMGFDPGQLTVFEDSLHSAESAKRAGCRVVGLYDAANDDQRDLLKAACDYFAGGFDALLEG